jgi:hypothetical protein
MAKKESEAIRISYVVNDLGEGWSTISASWIKNGHPVGLFIRYSEQVSHKYAYSILQGGVWKALQDPDAFNISVEKFKDTPDGNPPPYAVLDDGRLSEDLSGDS